ncbi:MAG: CcmD family protein [Flavobacteriales bacterium]|nr:CcmD family protein [Flavobacteriales bacterium]
MNKQILTLLFLWISLASQAQSSSLEGTFYQSGKIYVVVTVVAIILLGMGVYLFSLDRKIKKLEDQVKQDQKN